jgi:hypothetical protein
MLFVRVVASGKMSEPITLTDEQLNDLVTRLTSAGLIYDTEPIEVW